MSVENTPKAWTIDFSQNGYMSFIPGDLRYFHNHFICKPMKSEWRVPQFELYGKRKRLGDFSSWMLTAPIVSNVAKEALEPLIGDLVEFLPFICIRNKQLWALNVLEYHNCFENYVDGEEIFDAPNYFRTSALGSVPPIFKCLRIGGRIYVTKEFGDIIVNKRLNGISLADPSSQSFDLLISGKSTNKFPGVCE